MQTKSKSTGPYADPSVFEDKHENSSSGGKAAEQGPTQSTGKQTARPEPPKQLMYSMCTSVEMGALGSAEENGSISAPEIPRLLNPSAWPPVGFRVAYREYLAEFWGTFILIFMGDGSVAASKVNNIYGGFVGITIGWGLAVAAALYVSLNISGGHINPAVTFANAVWGRFPWRKVPGYFLAQFLGAFVGAACAYGMYGEQLRLLFGTDAFGPKGYAYMFCTYPMPGSSVGTCIWCEFSGTLVLLFIVNGIFDKRNTPARGYEPIAVGLLVVAIGLNVGSVTGYAINPARDFGPRAFSALVFGSVVFTRENYYFIIPLFVPFIGGVVGMLLYLYSVPENTKTAVDDFEDE